MEEVYIDTIAYLEDGKGASILATFADEELYSLCAPVIEKWIKDKDPNYFLTESSMVHNLQPKYSYYFRRFYRRLRFRRKIRITFIKRNEAGATVEPGEIFPPRIRLRTPGK